MKKILYVTTISGFLPQFEKNDVKIMQNLGYEVHYASNFQNPIYTFDQEELKRQGIILHDIPIQKSPARIKQNWKAVRQLKKIIDTENIDIIHCHNPMGGVDARIAAHMSRKKPYVIYTAHGLHFYKTAPLQNWIFFYPVEKFLAKWTDTIITINKEDYSFVRNKFRLRRENSVFQIHGVGVNMERFQAKPDIRNKKREQLHIPVDAFHIVTAAELNENKNQSVVIKAIAELDREDIFYSICGKGPYERELVDLIRQLHLEKQVQLLGFRTDMDEILQTAEVFAFPSIREGLGVAAVEALACGVPLVVADNRGTREYSIHGKNAIVCNAGDITAFKEAIYKLYSNRSYRDGLSANCRGVAEKFSSDEVMKTMEMIYKHADQTIS